MERNGIEMKNDMKWKWKKKMEKMERYLRSAKIWNGKFTTDSPRNSRR